MVKLIKGNVDVIPTELTNRKARNSYEWDQLGVGDHYEFTNEADFPNIRSSSTSFAKGTKGGKNHVARAPITLRPREVETEIEGNKVKVLEVWRLADPHAPVVEAKAVAPTVEAPVEPTKGKTK